MKQPVNKTSVSTKDMFIFLDEEFILVKAKLPKLTHIEIWEEIKLGIQFSLAEHIMDNDTQSIIDNEMLVVLCDVRIKQRIRMN